MKQRRIIKNILVTGGAGFIGSAFIRYLLSKKIEFNGLCLNLDALTYSGNLANLKSVETDSRYLFHQGDIRQQSLVEYLCQEHAIDTIVHFAAESHVDRSISNPQTFIETNIIGTFHLLEVVRKNPTIHLHHVSTDEVYGSLGEKGFFSEESPYRPNSPYSATKAASDHLVRAYHETYGISTCISHCTNNYGPFQFPEKLIPRMILNLFERKNLPIYGQGLNIRDWLHVEDHAEALFLLLKDGKSGETYGIGGGAEWRNIDLIRHLIELFAKLQDANLRDLEKLMVFVEDRPGHDMRYAIDCSKIRKELGWYPRHSFSEGLQRTIMWYLENSEWLSSLKNSHLVTAL